MDPSNKKNYLCDRCGKTFAQLPHLMSHMTFHTAAEVLECKFRNCNERFAKKCHLTKHIRLAHPAERQFQCETCNKSFLTRSVLKQHLSIHFNKPKYECKICDKKFLRADGLTRHFKVHTYELPYTCRICNKKFSQKQNLKKHIPRFHPNQKA